MKSVFLKSQIKKLPDSPGIYKYFDSEGKLLYVGKSVSLKKRVASYFSNKNLGPKTNLLVKNIAKIEHIKVFSEFEALLLEAELIRTNQPFYNIDAKDDKSPIYIKISNDPVPLISTTRKEKPKRGVFLKGPFPSAKTTRQILRMIRGIFPYCHHKRAQAPCLFVHLGLCPNPYASEEAAQNYLQSIGKIKKLLSGKSHELIRELTKKMSELSKAQLYEEAAEVKKQIERLQYITTTYRAPREFLERPTLVDDLRMNRLIEMRDVLGLAKVPRRIECYDIANISGTLATGSMVVFTNGAPDKSQYRRFRIKFKNTPDDFEMMREVIARRVKNDWPTPDLMIIDGGRGQLNAALSMVEKYNYETTVVSLAKRFEEIYVPWSDTPISLPKENAARQLAQALRDEAHRFTNTYHRLLRSKDMLSK
ncbi:MAG TPA: GIY-YIG nuclease family protein [Candidatus Saccharimonadales bacterium]|nr:GIY-YIG nuclease family protein [Candidatus Saccharimonadales bacterium]